MPFLYTNTVRTLLLTVVVLLAGVSPTSAGETQQTEQDVDTFVFVGELVSIEELPDPCEKQRKETGEHDCISMDALYRARYRVVQPVVGKYAHAEVTFDLGDHYGFPPFAYFRNALLFVAMFDDGPWLHKYQGIAVHRTVDGQWASCGEAKYRKDNEQTPPQLRSLQFEEIVPAGDTNSEEWHRLVSRWKESKRPGYLIESGKVRCERGVLLPDLYDIVRNGVMKAREIPLPEWQTHKQ